MFAEAMVYPPGYEPKTAPRVSPEAQRWDWTLMDEHGRASDAPVGDPTYDSGERNTNFLFPTLLDTYDEMRRTSPVIAGLLSIFNLAVLGDEWNIQPAGADLADPEKKPAAIAAAAELEENLRAGLEWRGETCMHTQNFDDVLRNYLLCLPFGFSCSETIWGWNGPDKVRIARIAPRVPRSIAFFETSRLSNSDLIAVHQYVSGARPMPADKITLCSLNREGDNYAGRSMLRPVYQPYFLKNVAIRVVGMTIERNGMGIPTVEGDAGLITGGNTYSLSDDDRNRLNEALQGIRAGEHVYFNLPPGLRFSLRGVDGSLPDGLAFLNYLDRQQAIGLCLHVMTAALEDGGSYAKAETQDRLSEDVIDSIKTQLEQFMDAGFITQWWRYNYRHKGIRRPEFRFAHRTKFSLSTVFDIIGKLSGSTFFAGDDETWVRRQLGLPEKVSASPSVAPVLADPVQPDDVEEGGLHAVAAALRPGQQPWSPSRKVRPSERAVNAAGIRSEQDAVADKVARILERFAPVLARDAAAKVSKARRGAEMGVKLETPPGMIEDLAAALGEIAKYGIEDTLREIDRRQRG